MHLLRILFVLALVLVSGCTRGEDDAAPTSTPAASPTERGSPDERAEPCIEELSSEHAIELLPGGGSDLAACAVRTLVPERSGDVAVISGVEHAAAATVLAAHLEAPLLVHDRGSDAAPLETELARLRPGTVYALGSVSPLLVAEDQQVIGDDDPTRTATAVAETIGDGPAVIASVGRPLEALLAAVVATREDGVVLFTARDGLPDATRQALTGRQRVILVGGHDAIGGEVETELRGLTGEVVRISGPGLSELAASVARAYPSTGPRLVVSEGDRTASAVATWHVAVTGGAVVHVAEEGPDRGADRWLRVDGLAADPTVRLVGAADGEPIVAAFEQRLEEVAAGGPPAEFRGVWVHLFDDTLKTRRGIDGMLDRVAASNMNAVIVEVIRRHDAYHRSEVLPRTPDPALESDLDVLQRVIDGARHRGIAVHAWAPAMPAYHHAYDPLELPAGHVWREHGPGSSDPWVTFDHAGRPSPEFLDPGVPAVADHVVAMYAELAESYDVDGVHLDYVRYDSRAWGYNPAALARFRSETGRSDRPAPGDEQWSSWRRAQTRALAERISEAVHAAGPDVAVTLAGSTMGASPAAPSGYRDTRTFADVFQEWPDWLTDGVIDAVFPMHYFRDADVRQRAWYRGWLTFDEDLAARCREQRSAGCVVAIGVGAWLNPVGDGLTQVEAARARTDGVVVYSYQQSAAGEPTDELLRALPRGPFSDPAPAPVLR